MIISGVTALFIAWVLSLFDFDELVLQFVREWTKKDISIATYYVGAFIIGFIAGVFQPGGVI